MTQKADTAEAVNAYNKLRDQDEVVAIVGGTYSGTTLAFIETAVEEVCLFLAQQLLTQK